MNTKESKFSFSENQENQSFHSINDRSKFSNQSNSSGKYYDVNKDKNGLVKSLWNSSLLQSDADFHSVRPNIIKQKQIIKFECSVCNQEQIDCLEGQTVTQEQYQKIKAQIDFLTNEHQSLQKQTQSFKQIFKVSKSSNQNIQQQIQHIKKQIAERNKKNQQRQFNENQRKFGFTFSQFYSQNLILNKVMFDIFTNEKYRFQKSTAYVNIQHSIELFFRYYINQKGQYSVIFQFTNNSSSISWGQASLQFKGQLKEKLIFNFQQDLKSNPVSFSIISRSGQFESLSTKVLKSFLIIPPSLIFLQQRFKGIDKKKIENLKKKMVVNKITIQISLQSDLSSIKSFINQGQWFSIQQNGRKLLLFLHLNQEFNNENSRIVVQMAYKQRTQMVQKVAKQLMGIIVSKY